MLKRADDKAVLRACAHSGEDATRLCEKALDTDAVRENSVLQRVKDAHDLGIVLDADDKVAFLVACRIHEVRIKSMIDAAPRKHCFREIEAGVERYASFLGTFWKDSPEAWDVIGNKVDKMVGITHRVTGPGGKRINVRSMFEKVAFSRR